MDKQLTEQQKNIFSDLKQAFFNDDLVLLSVDYKGQQRACICFVDRTSGDYDLFPVAMVLELEDMDLLTLDGMVPSPLEN